MLKDETPEEQSEDGFRPRFVPPAALEESTNCLNMSSDLNKQRVCCHANVWEEE